VFLGTPKPCLNSKTRHRRKSRLINGYFIMARKRRSPVIASSTVASGKCLKRGKEKVMPAFEPIIRTRGQAKKESLNNDNNKIRDHANDFRGPKKSVERKREAGSTSASNPINVKKPHSHNTRYSKKVVSSPEMEESNVKKIQNALTGNFDLIDPSTMQKKDDKVDDKGVSDIVDSLELVAAMKKDKDFNKDSGTEVSKDDVVEVPDTVADSSELMMAAKKEVIKQDIETEASAIQKEKGYAVDKGPGKGAPCSFDMDHHCSVITLEDNDDPPLYIKLEGAHY
jgi:hypothetical protein